MNPVVVSKTAYYADFAIYAAVIGALMVIAALSPHWAERFRWLVAFGAGLAAWTLLEYLLHRFVLHQVPILSDMHALHHASPRAFVGTPTWLSIAILWLALFVPVWARCSFIVASGVIAGVMLGFLWYGILHHAIHHHRPRFLAARLTASIHRHLRHHHAGRPRNFGVSTPAWDYLLGTVDSRD